MPEIELMKEEATWRSRRVRYISGNWEQVSSEIPRFALKPFADETND